MSSCVLCGLGILKNTDKNLVQYISREDYLYSKHRKHLIHNILTLIKIITFRKKLNYIYLKSLKGNNHISSGQS